MINPAEIEAILSGQRPSFSARCLRAVLSLLEPCYALGITIQNWRYDSGWRSIHRVNVPVISLGNLTTGGTGKTPFAAAMIKLLLQKGLQPGLISRGYQRLNDEENDEKLVLEMLCPEIPHLQNRDRVTAAKQLISQTNCDCLILDDAFQHRRIHRDMDIVLIDATNPFGYGHLLPRGLLREPIRSLGRADLICLTRIDQIDLNRKHDLISTLSKYTSQPIVEVKFQPSGWLDQYGQFFELDKISKPGLAFCGIGNPNGFRNSLQTLGMAMEEDQFRVYPDHYHYQANDVEDLLSSSEELSNSSLVTTLKDLVKVRQYLPENSCCYALMIEADIASGKEHLDTLIQSRLV